MNEPPPPFILCCGLESGCDMEHGGKKMEALKMNLMRVYDELRYGVAAYVA